MYSQRALQQGKTRVKLFHYLLAHHDIAHARWTPLLAWCSFKQTTITVTIREQNISSAKENSDVPNNYIYFHLGLFLTQSYYIALVN